MFQNLAPLPKKPLIPRIFHFKKCFRSDQCPKLFHKQFKRGQHPIKQHGWLTPEFGAHVGNMMVAFRGHGFRIFNHPHIGALGRLGIPPSAKGSYRVGSIPTRAS